MVDLAGPNLLELLAPPSRQWLSTLARREKYSDGKLVHSRGDTEPAMGIVIEGRVRMFRMRRQGAESFVSLIYPGQHYGDILMFDSEPRTHSLIAVGDTIIDHYDAKAFGLVTARPEVLLALYRVAGVRLGRALAMIDDLRTLPREGHLAKLFLALAPTADAQGKIDCIQEDLAGILGVTSMTLAKALGKLKREGLVETGYRHIRITDIGALRAWVSALELD